jgi:hypothetical protein
MRSTTNSNNKHSDKNLGKNTPTKRRKNRQKRKENTESKGITRNKKDKII